jgi:hypothetical protein
MDLDLVRFIAPIEIDNGTIRRGWRFPEVCACCGEPADQSLEEALKASERAINTQTTYKLTVGVPYCSACMPHARARQAATSRGAALALGPAAVLAGVACWLVTMVSSEWYAIVGALLAGAVVGMAIGVRISKALDRKRFATIPRTERCTHEPVLSLDPTAIEVMAVNAQFIAQFRALGQAGIKEEAVKGKAHPIVNGHYDLWWDVFAKRG